MKNTTLSLVVGMTAVMILVLLGGVASAQTNSGSDVIGITNSGPFSLVKHGGFGFGWGFGGWGWNRGYGGYFGSGYGSGYYNYPNYGVRTEPYQTCTWTGYRWKCYNFDNGYFDNSYY
jgi:hypothetical protein